MPQKISLYEYLHEAGQPLTPQDKLNMAKHIAKAMQELHSREADSGSAHAHLSSYNIMMNPSDFKVYIADYGLHNLKKYCKLFIKYDNLNHWSPPEMWAEP